MACFFRRLGELYTAAFAAAAGVYLVPSRQRHLYRVREPLPRLPRVIRATIRRHRHAELLEDRFTLIFVDLHMRNSVAGSPGRYDYCDFSTSLINERIATPVGPFA